MVNIGVPKELKEGEHRVALTPAAAHSLVLRGHSVTVEKGAGVGSGFTDEQYVEAGCRIADTRDEVWSSSDMILKVKEPIPEEFVYFREDLTIFTYLHLAANRPLTEALLRSGVTAVAYETVQLPSGALPLLSPMSEIAGRMSVLIGAQFLQKTYGGKGVLLSGVPGVLPANVVILGGGQVGTNAAKMAIGLGADVTIADINIERLRQLDDLFHFRVKTLISNPQHIREAVKNADLLIGAVLVPGAKAPVLVPEEAVRSMTPGSVIVDVAIDQGGSIETVDRVTTHSDPCYVKHGVVHYSVANMPGAVPRTATIALSNATLPYAARLAEFGAGKLEPSDPLFRGLNVAQGKITHKALAESLGAAAAI